MADLMAEIGEAVADVGDVSRILVAEDSSELGEFFHLLRFVSLIKAEPFVCLRVVSFNAYMTTFS